MENICKINSQNEFDAAVGRTMFFCQCIEHDIKSIYYGMVAELSDKEYEKSQKWTLGQTIDHLERLDNSDGKPYFPQEDYELLRKVTDIRNFYAHRCYVDWVYEEPGRAIDRAFKRAAKRLINDHNRLQKLHEVIQSVRIQYHTGE